MAAPDRSSSPLPQPPRAPRLGEVQELLYDLITAPTGAGPGLAARGLGVDALGAIVVGDGRLSAVERVDVYANMYFYRILDVLRDEFPRVVAAAGDAAFHDLVTDYLLDHRPAHPSLREAGARLPDHLATHALGAGQPWLAELARLERTHRVLFDGPDAPALTFDRLRALSPEEFAALPVRLIPCHAVLSNRFAVSTVWEPLAAAGAPGSAIVSPSPSPPPPSPPAAETILVWRMGSDVRHRVVTDGAESKMLERAGATSPSRAAVVTSATLGAICDAFMAARQAASPADGADGADQAALVGQAFQILARWVDDGLLTEAS